MVGWLAALGLLSSTAAADVWYYYGGVFPTLADPTDDTVDPLTSMGADVTVVADTVGTTTWPTDWTPYKLVIIYYPRVDFSQDDADRLVELVLSGSRLVLVGTVEGTSTTARDANERLNELLVMMDVSMAIVHSTTPLGRTCLSSTIYPDVLTDGVSDIWAGTSNEVTGGTALFADPTTGTPIASVAQPPGAPPRAAYDVVLSGSRQLVYSSCTGGTTRALPLRENLYPCAHDGPDNDADGVAGAPCGDDCDDNDSTFAPDAPETCDGLDQDCDGDIDEGVTIPYFADLDADGYGDPATPGYACSPPSGYVPSAGDCDDTEPATSPAAGESCDGLDNNCDASIDEGVTTSYFADSDGDTYGDPASPLEACAAPAGYVADPTDCDDTRADIAPNTPESCDDADNNCDGLIDEGVLRTFYADLDADGYGDPIYPLDACVAVAGTSVNNTDCDDTDPARSPDLPEVCDSVDNNCDGAIDEGLLSTFYLDHDADGYGDLSLSATACAAPTSYVADPSDCDDTNPSRSPGLTESCDTLDNDCDTVIDEGLDAAWYADRDADSFGDPTTSLFQCAGPAGYVRDGTDCDDLTAQRYPFNAERCDGLDNDCDTLIDEEVTLLYYTDADADGYGDPTLLVEGCDPPEGTVADATDCDDSSEADHPDAPEVCDGRDNDCDTVIDDGAFSMFYADTDADGHGDPTFTVEACDPPAGYVADSADCNDTSAATAPGREELADGQDNDCDGSVDNGTAASDDDGDGYTEVGGDCDDTDVDISPAAIEIPDRLDQDCDGAVDEDTTRVDDDGDGWSESGGDCNDADPLRSPGLPEIADNGLDDDCDGTVDDGVLDPDSDGYASSAGDCDPTDGSVFPGAPERENGDDDDCDGVIDEGTEAYDNDGDGVTERDGDCDDENPHIVPGTAEQTNGYDDNCDGVVDEGTAAYDDDGDGFTEEGGDCDDGEPGWFPGASDGLDGQDNDCDGAVDEGTDDRDGDGVTRLDGDCNDADGWVRPNLPEMCDWIDNNCDGVVDEGCEGEHTVVTELEAGGASKPAEACSCGIGRFDGVAGAWVLGAVAVGRARRRGRTS